jgi:hypothetical protein
MKYGVLFILILSACSQPSKTIRPSSGWLLLGVQNGTETAIDTTHLVRKDGIIQIVMGVTYGDSEKQALLAQSGGRDTAVSLRIFYEVRESDSAGRQLRSAVLNANNDTIVVQPSSDSMWTQQQQYSDLARCAFNIKESGFCDFVTIPSFYSNKWRLIGLSSDGYNWYVDTSDISIREGYRRVLTMGIPTDSIREGLINYDSTYKGFKYTVAFNDIRFKDNKTRVTRGVMFDSKDTAFLDYVYPFAEWSDAQPTWLFDFISKWALGRRLSN